MTTTTTPDLGNPFPGLRCFQSDEDYLFFGRHAQIEDLLRRLRTNRLVAVVGTSGSGKSSLVRAGLLPAVLGGGMSQAGSAWQIAVMRPGGSPLIQLAKSLCDAGLYNPDDEDVLPHLQATLGRSRNGLIQAVRQSRAAAGAKLLLVVDQFEELFRFNRASAESQEESIQFVDLLLQAAREAENVYVVLTMRSDFLGECSQFLGLAEAVNDGEFLIPRMTRDQIQEAIEGPIRVQGAEIAPRLLFRLLNDVEDDQDQLPVLQHALMRTWALWSRGGQRTEDGERRTEDGGRSSQSQIRTPLDLEHYEATGGMHHALSRHADEIFEALPSEEHRTAATRLFKALTERRPDGRGIRRPTRLGALAAIVGLDQAMVRLVIEAYRAPGVTFLMPPVASPLDDNSVIDISHESLMRTWTQLRLWVEEEAQSARIYRRLLETAALHSEKRAGLYHDPDLQVALSWRDASQPNAAWAEQYGGGFEGAMAFLDQSRAVAEREEKEREAARQRELDRAQEFAQAQAKVARLFKRFAGSLAVGLCAAVALSIWAFNLRHQAKRQESVATSSAYAAQMLLAQSDWEHANLGHINKLLAETAAYPGRGFEWFYWQRLCHLERLTFRGHSRGIRATVFAPDGKLVASAGDDRTVRLWDPQTGREKLVFREHTGSVKSVAFSPDGTQIASGGDDGALVWEVATGRVLATLEASIARVDSLAFSPEGRRVVGGGEGLICVWDAQTGEELREPIKADNWDYSHISVRWAPDGHHVATSSLTGRARLFDLDSGEAVFTTEPIHDVTTASGYSHWYLCLAYSPDGRHIALGQLSGAIIVRDAHTGELIHNWKRAHDGEIESIGYSPDGSRIVTSGLDQTVKVWDAATGAQLFTLKGHRARVDSVAYSPDGRFIVSGDGEGMAKVWDADGSREWILRTGETNEVALVDGTSLAEDSLRTFNTWRLVFSPDGRRFLSGTWANRPALRVLSMRDTDSGRPLWSHPAIGPHAAFFPDGRKLVAAQSTGGWNSRGSRLCLLDAQTGKTEREFDTLEAGAIEMLAVSADGRRVYSTASVGRGGLFQIWDSQTGHEIDHRDLGTQVENGGPVAVSPDDRRIAFGTKNLLSIADLDTGRLVFEATNSAELISLAWSPDGKRIATGDWAHAVTLWDAQTGQKIVSMLGHLNNGVTSLCFSPDGQRLLSTCHDNTARLWDTGSGRELLMFKGPSAGMFSGAIAPNGRTLLLGGTFNWMTLIASATPEDVARWERQERDADELRRAERLKAERVTAAR